MSTSQPTGVSLRSVSRHYGETVAVKDLSLEIEPGEFLFVLGPSGAGKTTVLRLIGGYEQPDSGQIIIGGRDVTGLPPEQRNIGTVFQSYALFPHYTVFQNVAFGLQMRRASKKEIAQRVAEALTLVELDGLEKRYPHQLSGGQQQRVALARAIVYRPALLLLDEPLANLDRRLRDTMRVELKQLQRRIGITAIMVTHDQEESLSMADRIAVMHRGSLEQIGPPAAIYNQPVSPFVAAFIGEVNILRGEVTADKVRLRVGKLDFDLPPGQYQPDTEVTLYLRAERIRLLKETADTTGFPATIEFVTYLGATTLYLIRLVDGPTLKVLEANSEGEVRYQVGERVMAVVGISG